MRTGAQYVDSLDDGRAVYLEGQRIDVGRDPVLAEAVRTVGAGYDRWHRDDPGAVNPALATGGTAEELAAAVAMTADTDFLLNLTRQALLCLMTASGRIPEAKAVYADRIVAFSGSVREHDSRVALCITDAKGNRSRSPLEQDDPDAYTRVVERRPDGVVIRGAKLHIAAGPLAHELLVMPTKAMHEGEEDYAICCAVPVNAPGVSIVATSSAPRSSDARDYPVSSRGVMPDGFVIFDDVFVPTERIFLDGEVTHAAVFAHSLGLWVRLTDLTEMAEDADVLVGLAQLMADANGLSRVPHIREKLADMILFATLIRAGLLASLATATVTEQGLAVPGELYTNAAKFYGAQNYLVMLRNLQDIAGGSVVTAPSMADLENPEIGGLVDKYMSTGAAVDGRYRLALLHAVRDMTADTDGGHTAVAHLHGGGGLYAQRLVARKNYDLAGAKRAALLRIGLAE